MANTLNVGNGDWATKENSLLGYNSENGNYKPLPFDFTRASNGTFVNKSGLIETAANGVPRIDFLGNTSGALLLEPQRTNLITYSSDFSNSYWSKSGASIKGDPSTAGSELVTNGDFATDSDWTKGAGWTIGGGTANCDVTTEAYRSIKQNTLTIGKTYKVTFSITSYTSGSLRASTGSVANGIIRTSIGTYTEYLTCSGNNELAFYTWGSFVGSIDNVSVKEVQGFSSPSGDTSAFKLVEDTSTGLHKLQKTSINVSVGSVFCSYFVKKAERSKVLIELGGGGGGYATFNLDLGTVIVESNVNAKIELISNGWYRCSVSYVTSATSIYSGVYLTNDLGVQSYQGDGTSGLYVYGAQAEQGSYATSLINTQGSAVTRVQDVCNNGGNDQVINSTEGVLYWEASALADDGTDRRIALSDGTLNNYVSIGYSRFSGNIIAEMISGGVIQTSDWGATGISQTNNNKFAMSWGSGTMKFYINGVQKQTASVTSPIGMNNLRFSSGNGFLIMFSNTKDLKVYNTALTDAELIALTQV